MEDTRTELEKVADLIKGEGANTVATIRQLGETIGENVGDAIERNSTKSAAAETARRQAERETKEGEKSSLALIVALILGFLLLAIVGLGMYKKYEIKIAPQQEQNVSRMEDLKTPVVVNNFQTPPPAATAPAVDKYPTVVTPALPPVTPPATRHHLSSDPVVPAETLPVTAATKPADDKAYYVNIVVVGHDTITQLYSPFYGVLESSINDEGGTSSFIGKDGKRLRFDAILYRSEHYTKKQAKVIGDCTQLDRGHLKLICKCVSDQDVFTNNKFGGLFFRSDSGQVWRAPAGTSWDNIESCPAQDPDQN